MKNKKIKQQKSLKRKKIELLEKEKEQNIVKKNKKYEDYWT
jgi:hypothetical protein